MFQTVPKQTGANITCLPGNPTGVMATRILLMLIAVVIWLASAGASHAIIINQPMTDATAPGWVFGGSRGLPPQPTFSAYLTASTIDSPGNGWLRLTDATNDEAGFAYFNTSFDLSQGAIISFDYATYGGNGADGYSVFLFDGSISGASFNIGASGGSLGYAQKTTVTPNVPGISGGYIGIGVDEFGNFSNPSEGRYLGPGARPSAITIRGPVNPADPIGASYPYIGGTAANIGTLWFNQGTRPVQTSNQFRKVIIRLTPVAAPNYLTADVFLQYGYGQPLTQVISGANIGRVPPASVKIGFAASTGGQTNIHEIRNLLVINSSTATDIGITKAAVDTSNNPITSTSVGSQIRYLVTARNYGPNTATATGVGIVDNVPANITGVTWTCAVVSGSPAGTSCGAGSGSGNSLNTTANLAMGGAVTYTINGTVGAPAPSPLNNTASLVIPGGVNDYDPVDDSATASVTVPSNLSTSTKTWADTNGGDQNPNDVLQFTVTLNETSGTSTSNVSVTDTLAAALTNLTVVSLPAGATNSSTATQLNITGINVPANGSVSIVFRATIAGGTVPGALINNTATVTNPGGTGATPSSPTITVSASQVAASGNKPLYLYDNASSPANKLSRTPMPVNAGSYVAIPRGNNTQSWILNPALAADVTINSGAIPVQLWLATNSSRNYNIPVTLRCGGTSVATASQTVALNGTVSLYTFSLPRATAYTCPAGSAWRLDVTNSQGTGAGLRDIRVYPAPSTGNYSNVSLSSQNVINVNSVTAYSAAYPATATPPSGYFSAGQTAYIRAVVQDPFGSYDITSTTVTIKDPDNNTVLVAGMPQVADSGTLTKTYEIAFPVPAGPNGFWTASVIAKEGNENTVTHTATGTFQLQTLPNITVLKYAFGVASGASARPGQEIPYSITVSNTGSGVAGNVVVVDCLSPYTAWTLGSFTFTDGSAPSSGPSGLSLTNSTMYYSSDNGANWSTTPPANDGTGHAPSVTCWRLVMDPAKSMNASPSSFILSYQAQVK